MKPQVAAGANGASHASDSAPPEDLAKRVGGTTGAQFLAQGANLKRCLIQSLPPGFSLAGKKILDFGCGSGRVLRHFNDEAASCQLYGCDIDEPSIEYMQAHFPQYRTFVNGERPPLDIADETFDLIYCVSVFTHLPDTWQEWLQELHRILKPGGLLLASYLNKTAYESTVKLPFEEVNGFAPLFLDRPWERGGPNLYATDDWIIENWGRYFCIEAIIEEGMMNWQSIAIMRKGEGNPVDGVGLPRRIRPFIYQDHYDKTVVANVEFNKFPAESWHDRCGIQASGRSCVVRGWATSKAASIRDINFFVDGAPIDSSRETTSRDGVAEKYPDYVNPAESGFLATLDISEVERGAHDLVVVIKDAVGNEKTVHATLVKD